MMAVCSVPDEWEAGQLLLLPDLRDQRTQPLIVVLLFYMIKC